MKYAQPCKAVIEGPKIGKRVVLWREPCHNKTKDESGYCWQHRKGRL